jgi:hypothetical protein
MPKTGSSMAVLFRLHYLDAGVLDWDKNRVLRLAGLTKLTVEELGAWLGCREGELERYMQRGQLPGTLCILMTLAERWTDNLKFGVNQKPVFPSLPHDRP